MEAHLEGIITTDEGIRLRDIECLQEIIRWPFDTHHIPTVLDYALCPTTGLTEILALPGRRPNSVRQRCRTTTLLILRRMFHCLLLLHRRGLTLRGRFTLRNFVLYAESTAVRMTGIHVSRYMAGGLEGGGDLDLDYGSFHRSVEQMFVMEAMPDDIVAWLELIAQGACGDEVLIRYNICLMEHRRQVAVFMDCVRAFRRVTKAEPWLLQPIVDALVPYKKGKDGGGGKEEDVRDALKQIWDWYHDPALDHDDNLFALVVDDEFPRIFMYFFEAMFRVGSISELDLEATAA